MSIYINRQIYIRTIYSFALDRCLLNIHFLLPFMQQYYEKYFKSTTIYYKSIISHLMC